MSDMERNEQVRRNLTHALAFLEGAIVSPDGVPDRARVVFMPSDDPELRAANSELITASATIVIPSPRITGTGTITPPITPLPPTP